MSESCRDDKKKKEKRKVQLDFGFKLLQIRFSPEALPPSHLHLRFKLPVRPRPPSSSTTTRRKQRHHLATAAWRRRRRARRVPCRRRHLHSALSATAAPPTTATTTTSPPPPFCRAASEAREPGPFLGWTSGDRRVDVDNIHVPEEPADGALEGGLAQLVDGPPPHYLARGGGPRCHRALASGCHGSGCRGRVASDQEAVLLGGVAVDVEQGAIAVEVEGGLADDGRRVVVVVGAAVAAIVLEVCRARTTAAAARLAATDGLTSAMQ